VGISVAWLVLAGVNFARGHANIGVVYLVVGLLSVALAYFFRPRGRRTR
jgi:membrane associated rhomboid family serine protease